MKCSWCGGDVSNGATICPHCEAPFDKTEIESALAEEKLHEKKRNKSRNTILTIGIISLAIDYLWVLSPIGLVLSIITKVLVGGYKKRYGEVDGKARAGSVLSTIGLILGIILTIVFIIYVALIFATLSETPELMPDDMFELIM